VVRFFASSSPKKHKKVYYAFIGVGREVNERKILPLLSVVMFGDEMWMGTF
jgi:hypothetical protein